MKNNNSIKKIFLFVLLILLLLPILRKNYIVEVINKPSIKVQLIKIAKKAIPIKNNLLFRSVDDQIAILKTSRSCVFCDLAKGKIQ
jgi:hypothetical protein